MKLPWRDVTRDCVTSARFILYALLLFSVFAQTRQQQRDIKSKWDNRLLPTNSVYEQPQKSVQSEAGNVPSIRSKNDNKETNDSRDADRSLSIENVEEGEIIYEDDYETEEIEEEAANGSSLAATNFRSSASNENSAKNEKLNAESTRDTSNNREDDYYYYDYENTTNPENQARGKDSVDYFDFSEEKVDPTPSEKHQEIPEITLETSSKPISSTSSPSIEESSLKDHSSMEIKSSNEESNARDGQILIGEAVVSVVTTKSVVNGTISVAVSPLPITTEQMLAPTIPSSTPNPGMNYFTETEVASSTLESGDAMETTEDSRIVASVQTSRSISGARFLPFLVVEGVDKNSPDDVNHETAIKDSSHDAETTESLIEKLDNVEEHSDVENDKNSVNSTTIRTSLPAESTESIIDKLDRVQSELSSGFHAGGFRTSGNTLQLDVLGEQRPQLTRKSYSTTSRTPVISKFVPRRYNQERKASVTSVTTPGVPRKNTESLSLNEENGKNSTDKLKFRWPSASRNSRPTSSTTESHLGARNNARTFGFNSPVKPRIHATTVGSIVQDISAFLPPGYKLKKEDAEVTEKSVLSEILAKSKVDISALLPANYSPKVEEEKTKDESIVKAKEGEEEAKAKIPIEKNLESLFSKGKLDFSSLLPEDYNADKKKMSEDVPKVTGTTEKAIKAEKSLQDLFSKTSVDISALLPPGYNRFKKDETVRTEKPTETTSEASTAAMNAATTARSTGGIKLVFPSRPGGRKALHKAATTTHSSRAEGGGSGAVSPKIQKGWPVRATTEFTGWPTPSTTPISIEKLLEAARTATVASTNVSLVPITSTSSTTSTSTTTTTTQRPTTPGICEDECEVAGTIRIVGNATWLPELLDRNTREWQLLAEEIEKEMNLVFVKSSVLRKWYKRVRIDAFSPGSILVDYFIELTDLNQRINTQELKLIFHDSLRTYNTEKWNETTIKGPIRLGAFTLDPKSTDFVVIPKISVPQHIEADDRLIPQWAIAVIVIGVGGLLFIIIFGVSVLVNRRNAAKSKPSQAVYTEEVAKNMIQASHGAPSHRSSQDYPKSEISTIWNDTTVWRDKSFESNSNEVLVDGSLAHGRHTERQHADDRKYNMYDSWRSEWNGYYYNPSQGSSKFAGYESTNNLSRHPPDYDTNF